MFFNINYDSFPIIKITIDTNFISGETFQLFLDKWEEINNMKKKYILIFDTSKCGLINIKYIYKLTKFINTLKNLKEKNLEYSIIYVRNKIVKNLLNITFKIQKPISYTFIVNDYDDIDIINKDITYIINNYQKMSSKFYLVYP